MSSEILDISITNMRIRGERRYSEGFLKQKKAKPISDFQFNPKNSILNHRKHEAKIFRESTGGLESRANRYYGILDWF